MHGQQKIKVIQQNQEPSPQSTTRRNTKTFKNVAYHLDTASTIYKKNGYVQTEINARKHEEAKTCICPF
jgi:hypothetical protein